MRSILATTRALIGEWKLASSDWNMVISTVMTALNSRSLELLGYKKGDIARSHVEEMTGITPRRPILRVAQTTTSQYGPKPLSLIWAPQLIEIKTIQTDLNNLHKDVAMVADRRRQKAI